ncbi:MAG: hypothetical protein R2832_05275 [Rhodothermales bacterium]
MSDTSKASVDAALASIRDIAGRPSTSRRSPGRRLPGLREVLLRVSGAVAAVLLPFLLMLRVSTSLYVESSANHWVAIAFGLFAAGIVLLLYVLAIGRRMKVKGAFRFATRFIPVLVLSYAAYALLYLSAGNAKTSDVADGYGRLHPILRIAVSTWILADRDALVTDTERRASDYASMGLSPRERSLHYSQPDGYVHAVDLRTIGRSEIRNRFLSAYFKMVGFRTLRHVGTADHLHVSLPVPD